MTRTRQNVRIVVRLLRRYDGAASWDRTSMDQGKLIRTRELLSFFQEDSMVRRLNSRLLWLTASVAVMALTIALPASAQSTGMVRGAVKDAAGKPVEGAKIIIDAEGSNRHFETKSDKKGEFIQIGLAPGPYKVSAEKDKLAAAPVPVQVRINPGAPITLVLGGAGGGMSTEAAAKNAD